MLKSKNSHKTKIKLKVIDKKSGPSNTHQSTYDDRYEDSFNTFTIDNWGIAGDPIGELTDMDFTLVDDE